MNLAWSVSEVYILVLHVTWWASEQFGTIEAHASPNTYHQPAQNQYAHHTHHQATEDSHAKSLHNPKVAQDPE